MRRCARRSTIRNTRRPSEQVIAANLDRVRAIPEIPQGKHILVDAASARLWMYDGDKVVNTMKVVVGNPELGETPMMAGWIRWAIENPYWEVPDDITQKEIAPDVLASGVKLPQGARLRGPGRLDRRIRRCSIRSTVDWKAVHDGTLKVHVRQLPGGENFMGKVKFEFPNREGIYLHDTPAKQLMKEDARQLSHGCIRMENAAAMHQWLMGEPIPTDITQPEDKVPLRQAGADLRHLPDRAARAGPDRLPRRSLRPRRRSAPRHRRLSGRA